MIDPQLRQRLKRRFYPRADDDLRSAAHWALDRYLTPDTTVLDAGCGRGTWVLDPYRDRISRLVGVDVEAPRQPNVLDSFMRGDLERLPLSDGAFDVVFCWDVVEHLARPAAAFAEMRRVLKPGGALLIKTPSLLSPLMLASRLSPTFVHRKLKRALLGMPETGVFPTLYRCNTPGRLHTELTAAGLRREALTPFDQTYDYYLPFSGWSYALGLLYSRALNVLPLGEKIKASVFGVYRKPRATAASPTKRSESLAAV